MEEREKHYSNKGGHKQRSEYWKHARKSEGVIFSCRYSGVNDLSVTGMEGQQATLLSVRELLSVHEVEGNEQKLENTSGKASF